ncbi:hypothetical protein [Paracoccus versutus]
MTKNSLFNHENQEKRVAAFQLAVDEIAGMTAAGASDGQMSKALKIPRKDVHMIRVGIQAGYF